MKSEAGAFTRRAASAIASRILKTRGRTLELSPVMANAGPSFPERPAFAHAPNLGGLEAVSLFPRCLKRHLNRTELADLNRGRINGSAAGTRAVQVGLKPSLSAMAKPSPRACAMSFASATASPSLFA